jgi:hypothetical protein
VPVGSEAHMATTRSLRLGIAVIQSVWPVVQEWVRVVAPGSTPVAAAMDRSRRRQAVVRQCLERLRFVLRIALLVRYWKQMHTAAAATNKATNHKSASVLPGLLLGGGGLYSHAIHERPVPYQKEQARIERMEYLGRRTGRRVAFRPVSASTSNTSLRLLRILLGELLYVLRPLLQAEADVATCQDVTATRRMRVWALCLGMDLLSLWSIAGDCSGPHPSANAVTVNEWKRRRMRLFLYVLRSPIWDRYTEPAVQRVDDIVYRFPLVGGLMRNFIWDWIYYWKVFRAEEG